ncbi:hypothetical protein CRG98_043740, partial [Punica granatum]
MAIMPLDDKIAMFVYKLEIASHGEVQEGLVRLDSSRLKSGPDSSHSMRCPELWLGILVWEVGGPKWGADSLPLFGCMLVNRTRSPESSKPDAKSGNAKLGVCMDTGYTRNRSEPTAPLRRSPLVSDRPLRRSPLVSDRPQTIRHMIEDDCADNGIPLSNATSKILAKVVEYYKKHVEAAAESKSEDRPSPATAVEDELKAWDADFVK